MDWGRIEAQVAPELAAFYQKLRLEINRTPAGAVPTLLLTKEKSWVNSYRNSLRDQLLLAATEAWREETGSAAQARQRTLALETRLELPPIPPMSHHLTAPHGETAATLPPPIQERRTTGTRKISGSDKAILGGLGATVLVGAAVRASWLYTVGIIGLVGYGIVLAMRMQTGQQPQPAGPSAPARTTPMADRPARAATALEELLQEREAEIRGLMRSFLRFGRQQVEAVAKEV